PVRRAPGRRTGRWEPGTSGRSSGALPEARHVAASAKYAATCWKFRIRALILRKGLQQRRT
ncbi:MAG: hypothetical protein LBT40_18565, partial [Deltaproteobacteria bacterium]|nr:hypothetical protein [Deltaproteobacteria bacterium]